MCGEFQAALGIGGGWLAFTKGDVHLICGGQLPMSVGPTGQGVAGGQEAPPPQFPTVLTGAPGYPSGTSSLSAKRLFFGREVVSGKCIFPYIFYISKFFLLKFL